MALEVIPWEEVVIDLEGHQGVVEVQDMIFTTIVSFNFIYLRCWLDNLHLQNFF